MQDPTAFADGVCSPGRSLRVPGGKPGEPAGNRVSTADHGNVIFAAFKVLGRIRSTVAERGAVHMQYGPGDLERYRRRVQNQKRCQRNHREKQAEDGIPERDDVAKVVLAATLERCAREPELIDGFVEKMSERLTREKKRFDKDRSAEVLRNMVERHREGVKREARRRRAAERERQT